jgi:hypothetical protein
LYLKNRYNISFSAVFYIKILRGKFDLILINLLLSKLANKTFQSDRTFYETPYLPITPTTDEQQSQISHERATTLKRSVLTAFKQYRVKLKVKRFRQLKASNLFRS